MITYVVCDLFQSPARVLVNTVNTVGVMGKGIAKDFKAIYPEMFREYQMLCERKALDTGKLWLFKTTNKWVLNFPTKRHWRQPSRPEYIESGLQKFVDTYHLYGITDISFPLLGCGHGELDWETQVRPLMERYLNSLPITAFIHLQQRKDPFTPEHRDIQAMQEWLRGEPESLSFTEVWDDLCSMLSDKVEFRSTDSNELFTAKANPTADTIEMYINGRTEALRSDALTDLWQQLRRSGFVSGTNLPSGLDSLASHVVPVMSLLPYVKRVLMANRYGRVNAKAIGLRLMPKTRPAPTPLLAGMGAVEPA